MRTNVWLWGAAPACPSSPVMGVVSPCHGWEAYLLGRLHPLQALLVLLLVVHVARHAPAQSYERGPSDMSTGERQSFAQGSDSHLYVPLGRRPRLRRLLLLPRHVPAQPTLPAPPRPSVCVCLCTPTSQVYGRRQSAVTCKGPSQGDEGLDLPLLPRSRALFLQRERVGATGA